MIETPATVKLPEVNEEGVNYIAPNNPADPPKRLMSYFKELYDSLQKAIKVDRGVNQTLKDKGLAPNSHSQLVNWFKSAWFALAIIFVAGVLIWRIVRRPRTSPYRDGRPGHHGYNKYGERY
jgi:hypothetical protein